MITEPKFNPLGQQVYHDTEGEIGYINPTGKLRIQDLKSLFGFLGHEEPKEYINFGDLIAYESAFYFNIWFLL